MKLFSTLAALFAVLASALFAQPAAPETVAPDTATRKHSLWKATKGAKTIHLLGSVHVTTEDMLPLPAVMNEAIDAAEAVMFETDLKAMSAPATQIQMAALAMYADGSTLKDHVPEKLYDDVEAYLKEKGIPMQFMDRMKPWSLAISVIPLMELKGAGFDVTSGGVDKHVDSMARKAGKPVIGLESLEFYQKLFAGLENDDQIKLLESALKDAPEAGKQAKEMIRHWQTGNAEHLEAFLKQNMKDHAALEKKLLLDRNIAWIPSILKASDKHSKVVVVVGAGHLVGDSSVSELLQKEGWTIEQQ